MANSGLEPVVPVLAVAAQPIVIPVPAGAVKVLPRWNDEDEVVRWRLMYRAKAPSDPVEDGEVPPCQGPGWVELELRSFTRELPLTSLRCGEVHYFTIALDTPKGWSDWSRVVSAVPPAPELPGKCAAVFAIVKDDTTAHVRWTRPIDFAAAVSCGEITHYKLLVTWRHQLNPDEDPAKCRKELLIEEDTDCYDVPDLTCQCDYQFQVAAKNITGWGEPSDPSPVLRMPLPVPPVLPQPPKLRRATHHTAVIQWHHPTSIPGAPIESFRFRYTTSKDWKSDVEEIHDVPPNLSQYVVDKLRPGETYLFQARALNKYGMGIWSDSSIPVRTMDGREPSKITGLCVPHVYRSFVTLQWPPAEENGFEVTKHLLKYSHKEDMSDSVEVAPNVIRKGAFDTCDLRHLKKTQYHFQVAAFNKQGMSEWSDHASVDLSVQAALKDA